MASVYEIAAHISARLGSVDRFKLHKLVYYVQAWSLVWRDQPAFVGPIEAWKHGPVASVLQAELVHRGDGLVRSAKALSPEDAAHVDRVLVAYGHLSADDLIRLTHGEEPWLNARGSLPPTAPSSAEITHEAMRSFYRKQWAEADADNDAIESPPEFVGSIDELEAYLDRT